MKIKARILNDTTIELLEDAKTGDTIDLKDLVGVDISFLTNKIQQEASSLYQKQLNEKFELEKKTLEQESNEKLKDLETKKQQELKDLENKKKDELRNLEIRKQEEITKLQNELNNIKELNKQELDKTKLELSKDYELKISDLNNKLANKDKDKEIELDKLKTTLTSDFNNKYQALETKIKDSENDLKLKELAYKSEKDKITQYFELEKTKLENDYKEKISTLTSQLDNLKLQKSSLNVKKLGEELERWCNEEYSNYSITGFKNCTWEKDNKSVQLDDEDKGTKADYIFTVYLDETKQTKLTSVCLEMKNEGPNSTNKKKNSDHFSKLEKDRTKKDCEYALLVSELEWDSPNDSPIKVVPNYEKMYVVRPTYFITFLGLIYSLAEKYRELLLVKEKENIELKDKTDLITEFDDLINTYLKKPLTNLQKDVESIKKNSEAITKANQNILDTCDNLINKTILNMNNKIETLEIKKLKTFYNKLDKVNKE